MKFRVHVFEEIHHTFTISAKDIDEAATLIESGICANRQRWESSEPTGDFSDEALIDPLNEDGAVDYENATWYTRDHRGDYVYRGDYVRMWG